MISLLAAGFLFGHILAAAQSGTPLPEAPVASAAAAKRLSLNGGVPRGQWLWNSSQWQANFYEKSSQGLLIPANPISLPGGGTTTDSLTAPLDGERAYSFAGSEASEPSPGVGFPDTRLKFGALGAHLDLAPFFAAMNRPSAGADRPSEEGHYSVEGLLWQSLAFTGIENGYRIATDGYMRDLIAHGPYWSNYGTSMRHWDMDRWSDGDDFVVDEIGHPMQGAVSGFIEIQNGPHQRLLRFSNSKAYWRSRLLALMWATVFSTQQKIGPLGEAALGGAGGYTYVPGCGRPCPTWRPGQPYLNNTGWTDFIMTPLGGTVWIVMEDILDHTISDRVESRHPDNHVLDNIVRGALNPTRTMANLVRWRNPWYRDFKHYPVNRHITPGIHFIPSDEDAARGAPRFELFPHFAAISLPVSTEDCTDCRRTTPGYGVGFSARLARWVDFDSDVDYHSNASPLPSARAGGSAILGTFGLRTGVQYTHYAVKVSLRPGFLSYSDAYTLDPETGLPTANIGRVTHFAIATAVNADYDVSRHFGLRAVLGNTAVRYRKANLRAPGVGAPPFLNWLSHEYFVTNGNWTYHTGVVLRF